MGRYKATLAAEEEPETEENGGFEDYPEQPVLFPSVEETLLAQNIAERGKRRSEEQESSTYELFSLLTYKREKIKRRDEQHQ